MSVAEDFLQGELAPPKPAECIAFVGDNQTHDTVLHALEQFYPSPVMRDGGSTQALEYLAEGHTPKLVIIDVGDGDDPVSTMLSLATAVPDGVRLIGIGMVNDITLYRELIEAGIVDYLVKPVSERQIITALARLEEERAETEDADGDCQRIAVIGTRGGAGATSFAVNLSWLFAEEFHRKTTLIDLDLWFGTIALSLDLEPTRGLREALENPARIDGLFISSSTAKLTENLAVMAAEEALAGEMIYYAGATEILIDALSHSCKCLVMDLPRGAFRMRHPVLEAASHIALVTPPNLAGLRDSIRLLGAIDDAGASDKVRMVANRCGGPNQGMDLREFQKALGRKVDIELPDEPKAFNDAANAGKPLVVAAARSKAAKAMRSFASELGVDDKTGDTKAGRRLLGRFLKRA